MIEKINLGDAFARFDEHWSPRIAGRVNDAHVKLARLKGEFVWHHHEAEDEMFLVVEGSLLMQFRDREIRLGKGEFLIVPRGVEHRPVAEEETLVLLFEPASTLNTGNVRNERTVEQPATLFPAEPDAGAVFHNTGESAGSARHIETLAVHAGERPDLNARAVASPIYLASTFQRDQDGEYADGYVYGRYGNPNRTEFEECVAALEGGAASAAFASGMAATMSILQALDPGDHVVAPADAYFGTGALLRDTFARWGLETTFADLTDPDAARAALRPNTRLVWIETPTNPLLKVADIKRLAASVRRQGVTVVCDNTFATPVCQRPFELGADLILHSATKYLGGHGDVVGGVVVSREPGALFERIVGLQRGGGAGLAPFDAWLAMRGIKTLPYRVRVQSESAGHVARYLAGHAKVEAVHYPGLPSHPGHAVAARQMRYFGGMLSFQLRGTAADAIALAGRMELFAHATSLGGVHSLVEHRASIEGPASRTPGNLLRLSIGLEHTDDLIADLERGLRGD